MATALKNLSEYKESAIPSSAGMKFGIVISEYNPAITDALGQAAIETLIKHGTSEHDIEVRYVPGSFELVLGAQYFAEYRETDAVISLGCVIQGETKHFDFICEAVAQGIKQLNIDYHKPFIFGLLTTNNQQQAVDRAGGKHGNKGVEAAIAAIKMVHLQHEMESQ
ncbi:MAG: 6,7-dimethyl-8-ribityllumazine synthase [Bacteroidetes bacterium]|nr:6,7-dimethyl-8-ribityllumazine synthase [Bacteroidota bacterium]MBU1717659.1 6,7-dimethyl-8-ribityllumazine synthase [Bacteroidota bacterium]